MNRYILMFALVFAGAFILTGSTCQSTVTLAPGGAYTDPQLAVADQAILDASNAMTAFLAWNSSNATILAKYPEVGALATNVAANKDTWIKNAFAARDAYATAAKAYRDAKAAGSTSATPPDAKLAELNGVLAVINTVASQIVQYKAQHPTP